MEDFLMFKEKKNVQIGTDTLIGLGSEFEGKMKCATNLRIEGKFSGQIECESNVIIGESATVHSNIVAVDVVIAGKVIGDIHAKGQLVIMPTGQLNGNFSSSSLVIHEGGIFNGTSRMENSSPELGKEAKSPSKAKTSQSA
jgi:cytoskeletal protein CcmA (bactofilin family)